MAKCIKCNTKFIGSEKNNYKCPECGTEPTYQCPDCKNEILKKKSLICKKCGYFKCNICGNCKCTSFEMGWDKNIHFSKDAKDETICYIGYQYRGTKNLAYLRLHDDKIKKNKSLEEILQVIIMIARGKTPIEEISLCPRMIAISTIRLGDKSINNMMRKINLESKGQAATHYKELIDELKNIIKKCKENGEFTITKNKIIAMLPNSRRQELDEGGTVTRKQLETTICQGLLSKEIQGHVTQESVYEPSNKGICKYWDIKDGYAQCVCPTSCFEKYKLKNGRYIKIQGDEE